MLFFITTFLGIQIADAAIIRRGKVKRRNRGGYKSVIVVSPENDRDEIFEATNNINLTFDEPFDGPVPTENKIQLKFTNYDQEGNKVFIGQFDFDDEQDASGFNYQFTAEFKSGESTLGFDEIEMVIQNSKNNSFIKRKRAYKRIRELNSSKTSITLNTSKANTPIYGEPQHLELYLSGSDEVPATKFHFNSLELVQQPEEGLLTFEGNIEFESELILGSIYNITPTLITSEGSIDLENFEITIDGLEITTVKVSLFDNESGELVAKWFSQSPGEISLYNDLFSLSNQSTHHTIELTEIDSKDAPSLTLAEPLFNRLGQLIALYNENGIVLSFDPSKWGEQIKNFGLSGKWKASWNQDKNVDKEEYYKVLPLKIN